MLKNLQDLSGKWTAVLLEDTKEIRYLRVIHLEIEKGFVWVQVFEKPNMSTRDYTISSVELMNRTFWDTPEQAKEYIEKVKDTLEQAK